MGSCNIHGQITLQGNIYDELVFTFYIL